MEKSMEEVSTDERKVAERDNYPVYTVNGITYVPHFYNDSFFVGPDYARNNRAYTPEFLIRNGARKETAYLWKRGTTGRVENVST
jgi:hypothetical protein